MIGCEIVCLSFSFTTVSLAYCVHVSLMGFIKILALTREEQHLHPAVCYFYAQSPLDLRLKHHFCKANVQIL